MTPRGKRNWQKAAMLRRRQQAARQAVRVQATKQHNHWLDKAKAKTGSDGKTARILCTTPQIICNIRKGRRNMPIEQSARLAYLLGEPIVKHIALSLAWNAQRTQSRNFWLDFSCDVWPGRDLRYKQWADSKIPMKYPL